MSQHEFDRTRTFLLLKKNLTPEGSHSLIKTQSPVKLCPKRFVGLKHSVKLRLTCSGWVPVLIGLLLGNVTSPSGRCEILKHGSVVSGQHVLEVWGHGIRPEKVMVECVITVYALSRVQNQELIDEIQGVRVLHVGFEAVLYFSLLAFWKLHFLVQFILFIHSGPNLKNRRGRWEACCNTEPVFNRTRSPLQWWSHTAGWSGWADAALCCLAWLDFWSTFLPWCSPLPTDLWEARSLAHLQRGENNNSTLWRLQICTVETSGRRLLFQHIF